MLEQAVALAKTGDKENAREIPREIVADDAYNEHARGWPKGNRNLRDPCFPENPLRADNGTKARVTGALSHSYPLSQRGH